MHWADRRSLCPPMPIRLAAAVVVIAAIGLRPAPVRADTAVSSLAKYNKPVDAAIRKALVYLAKAQLKDGSFPGGMPGNTAVASLSIMAFLAAGHTPGVGPYGNVINKGVDFVAGSQKPNGMLTGKSSHGPMYSHGIATLMLSEVSGMLDPARQKVVDKALGRALKVILTAQRIKKPPAHQGGWRYGPTSGDSDISCTGWSLMALRSARNNGANVPKEAIDRAVEYVLRCRYKDGGFGYQPGGGSGLARTGTALLCLELCGKHRDKAAIGAGDWVLKHMPTTYGAAFFYYALYYTSQGMFQLGGHHWERFAAHMYQIMLKFQRKDGSWPQGSSHEARAGLCYSTAMGVLAMAVSYRQLPIYQR